MSTQRQLSPALIDIRGADVAIAGTTLLRDVHFRLEPGQHWGVVGANGSGKSTFLALLAGSRWPRPGSGTRTYDFGDGPQRDAVDAQRAITLVGHELQDRYVHWGWNFRAHEIVLSGLFRTDVPRRQPASVEALRARALLRELGLEMLAERPFLELSRGEQRRVLIARSLAFRPRILLLDEPASGLDARARAGLDETLERVAEHTRLVITGHSLDDVPGFASHILEIEQGRVVASGPAAEVRARHPRFDASHPRLPAATAHASRRHDEAAPPLIEVQGADVWLGGRCVLHRVDWRLLEGQHWLVRGANGAGKSTFLRLLHGQLRPALGGRIDWPLVGAESGVWALRRRVAWVSPELQAGYRYRSTVHDCIASGFDSSLGLVRPLRVAERERVALLLDRFELESLAQRPLTALSYGQFRRVLIARALVHAPRVLLLDEPWEGLDRPTGTLLAQRLAECVAEGTHLVCASHLSIDEERYTHELVLDRGRPRAAGARPGGDAAA